jgi:predicted nucleotidyltransferase
LSLAPLLPHTPDVSPLPSFSHNGELPQGVHAAQLAEVLERFGSVSARRRAIGERLRRIYGLATTTGQVARFILFGSFVTDAPSPNDVDVFLLMENSFDVSQLHDEVAMLFDHSAAQAYFGASVFWLRRLAALYGGTQRLRTGRSSAMAVAAGS